MIELKPCPFCGGEAELIESGNDYIGYNKTEIKCRSCSAKQTHRWIKFKYDYEFVHTKTIEAWNKRAYEQTD